MGCFLQCFGLSKKRKRRKTLYKVLAAAEQNHGNYVPMDSSVAVNLGIPEKAIVPYSGFRDECKEKTEGKLKTSTVKARKKVSFNLNVQIYEPNPYHTLESNDEQENDKDNEESKGKSSSSSILEDESEAFTMKYPSNYRYYNCRDIYDEDDEIAYEESDDEYDGFDDDEWDDDYSHVNGNHDEDKICVENSREIESRSSGQETSQNIHSVLCPVENLSQWKAIKAKVAPSKQRRKENIPLENSEPNLINLSPFRSESYVPLQSKPLLPEIAVDAAVDASLSTWLISPNSNGSATPIHCH